MSNSTLLFLDQDQTQINQGVILGSVGVGLGALSFLYIIAKSTIAKYIIDKYMPKKKTDIQFQNTASIQIDVADLDVVQQMLKITKTQYAIATITDTQG